MAETESGLVLVENWHKRTGMPRDNPPNSNTPIGTVGPNVPAGFGDTHAMYPTGMLEESGYLPEVQAWAGWPTGWDTPDWNGWGAGKLAVSTLWTCIDLNSRECASFPIYGMKGVKATTLPEWSNNPEPSLYSDWTEAAKQMFNTYQAAGEILLWATGRYADGSVARFVILNPSFVSVEWADGEIRYSLAGEELDRDDICHIKYQSYPSNLRGITPLQWAARNIISAQALEAYASDMATKGGIPWAVIKSQRKLNRAEAGELQSAWIAGSKNRQGAPAVLSGTIDLETLTTSPKDMALLELRIFDETRIASALGVPAYLVGLPMPDGLTYANAVNLLDFHWRLTLRTFCQAVGAGLSQWLLPRGTRMEFNREEYTRPDPLERAQTDATLFGLVDEKGNRAKTVDEIRMGERYEPNTPAEVEALQGII